jgi:WD40 repeat protein
VGAHFGSINVRLDDREAVMIATESIAREFKKKFLVGPLLNGWISVYPEQSGQEDACLTAFAKRLDCIVLHLMVYHDDILFYGFYRNGKLLSEYSSCPDHFEEVSPEEHERLRARPELFLELVGSEKKVAQIARFLRVSVTGDDVEFTFEQERLERFANLLGIENTLTSYEYLMDGERDGIKKWRQFEHVPAQDAEKAAKRAADAALRAEKRRLQKEGLLCVECLPPGNKEQRANMRGEFCFDPLDGSLLVLWHTHGGRPQPAQLLRFQTPWITEPQPVELSFETLRPGRLTMSADGKWFAAHDKELRVWKRPQFEEIKGLQIQGVPVAFTPDGKSLLCQSQQTYELVSLETMRVVSSFRAGTGSGFFALHPSNRFLITRERQDQLGIVNLESGKLEKVLFFGAINDWSALAPVFAGEFRKAGVPEPDLKSWSEGFVGGSDDVMSLKFSPDGRLLFCATTGGLCVLEWNKLLAADKTTPEPLFAVTPVPEATRFEHRRYENYVYDVVFDEAQSRLLFCGIEGRIRFLGLNDGKSGVLFDPPGKSPISELQLSPDREFLCCLSGPPFEDRDKSPWRIQGWNYRALTKAAGLGSHRQGDCSAR